MSSFRDMFDADVMRESIESITRTFRDFATNIKLISSGLDTLKHAVDGMATSARRSGDMGFSSLGRGFQAFQQANAVNQFGAGISSTPTSSFLGDPALKQLIQFAQKSPGLTKDDRSAVTEAVQAVREAVKAERGAGRELSRAEVAESRAGSAYMGAETKVDRAESRVNKLLSALGVGDERDRLREESAYKTFFGVARRAAAGDRSDADRETAATTILTEEQRRRHFAGREYQRSHAAVDRYQGRVSSDEAALMAAQQKYGNIQGVVQKMFAGGRFNIQDIINLGVDPTAAAQFIVSGGNVHQKTQELAAHLGVTPDQIRDIDQSLSGNRRNLDNARIQQRKARVGLNDAEDRVRAAEANLANIQAENAARKLERDRSVDEAGNRLDAVRDQNDQRKAEREDRVNTAKQALDAARAFKDSKLTEYDTAQQAVKDAKLSLAAAEADKMAMAVVAKQAGVNASGTAAGRLLGGMNMAGLMGIVGGAAQIVGAIGGGAAGIARQAFTYNPNNVNQMQAMTGIVGGAATGAAVGGATMAVGGLMAGGLLGGAAVAGGVVTAGIGVTIAAIAAVGVGLLAATDQLKNFSEAVFESGGRLALFDRNLARAYMNVAFGDMRRSFAMASYTSGSGTELANTINTNRNRWFGFDTSMQDINNKLGSFASNVAAGASGPLAQFAANINKWVDINKDKIGPGGSITTAGAGLLEMGVTVVTTLLQQIANAGITLLNTFLDFMGWFMKMYNGIMGWLGFVKGADFDPEVFKLQKIPWNAKVPQAPGGGGLGGPLDEWAANMFGWGDGGFGFPPNVPARGGGIKGGGGGGFGGIPMRRGGPPPIRIPGPKG